MTVRYGMREGGFRPDEHPRRAPDGYLRELSRRQAGKSNYTTTFVDATLFSETHIAVGYLILLDNGPTGSRSKGRDISDSWWNLPEKELPGEVGEDRAAVFARALDTRQSSHVVGGYGLSCQRRRGGL